MTPAFTPIVASPYPCNLQAYMIFNHKPLGCGGRTAPDKIIVYGLHGAAATVFYPSTQR